MGDVYGAVRDYLHIIKKWPNTREAYLGLVQCLISMKWNDIAGDWLAYYRQRFTEHANSTEITVLRAELAKSQKPDVEELEETPTLPDQEIKLRDAAIDFQSRYLGHCNTTTDIKVRTFLF